MPLNLNCRPPGVLLGPEHDRFVELVAGAPAAAVEDVLLQLRVPGLHDGVVAEAARPIDRCRPAAAKHGPERILSGLPGFKGVVATPAW